MNSSNIINRQGIIAVERKCQKVLKNAKTKHNSLKISRQKENVPPNVVDIQKSIKYAPERLGDCSDPQDAYDFDLEVYMCLKNNEMKRLPSPNYFNHQTTIKPRMRSIVIDWLVDVHKKLKMHTDTLFTAVEILDLFLSRVDFDKHNLQRLGCVTLMIASKSEEINAPDADDFVFFSRNSFTIREMHQTEAEVMKALDFRINPVHSSYFLKRFLRVAGTNLPTTMLAHFINEVLLLDSDMIGVCPSLRAAAVVFLSLSLRNGAGQWTKDLQANTGYSADALRPMVLKILSSIHNVQSFNLTAIYKKYSVDAVCRISATIFPNQFIY